MVRIFKKTGFFKFPAKDCKPTLEGLHTTRSLFRQPTRFVSQARVQHNWDQLHNQKPAREDHPNCPEPKFMKRLARNLHNGKAQMIEQPGKQIHGSWARKIAAESLNDPLVRCAGKKALFPPQEKPTVRVDSKHECPPECARVPNRSASNCQGSVFFSEGGRGGWLSWPSLPMAGLPAHSPPT